MCLEIYELDPARFLTAPGLVRQATFKNIKVRYVVNGIRGEICYAIHWYPKAYNKYMADYDKDKESLYLK